MKPDLERFWVWCQEDIEEFKGKLKGGGTAHWNYPIFTLTELEKEIHSLMGMICSSEPSIVEIAVQNLLEKENK